MWLLVQLIHLTIAALAARPGSVSGKPFASSFSSEILWSNRRLQQRFRSLSKPSASNDFFPSKGYRHHPQLAKGTGRSDALVLLAQQFRGGGRGTDDYYSPSSYSNNYGSEQSQPDYDDRYSDYGQRESKSQYEQEEERYYDYDDRGTGNQASSSPPSRSNKRGRGDIYDSLPPAIKYGNRKIGFLLLSSGAVTMFLGITLFFNKTLMRLGNLLFILGVPITVGPRRTMGYFFNPQKARATACLAGGIFLVMVGWPVFGIFLQVFGLLNIFGNMFPMLWMVVKNMPGFSSIFNNNNSNRSGGGNGRGRQQQSYNRRRSNDDYDDEQSFYNDGQQQDGYPDDDRYY